MDSSRINCPMRHENGNCLPCGGFCIAVGNDICRGLRNAYSFGAASSGKWIPVSERLPEMHTKVLCCGTRGGRFVAELTTWGDGYLMWDKRNGSGCPKVTHWMPLPEPPKEE